MGHKFEVNAVAVSFDAIVDYLNTVAFPAMYAVDNLLFFGSGGPDSIIDHGTIFTRLEIDTKKVLVEDVVANDDIAAIINFDSAGIF